MRFLFLHARTHRSCVALSNTQNAPLQLTDALEELGVPINQELAAAILKDIDADKSGSVSLEEFADFCVGLANRTWRPVTDDQGGVYGEGLGAGACAIIRGGVRIFEERGRVEFAIRREMRCVLGFGIWGLGR